MSNKSSESFDRLYPGLRKKIGSKGGKKLHENYKKLRDNPLINPMKKKKG